MESRAWMLGVKKRLKGKEARSGEVKKHHEPCFWKQDCTRSQSSGAEHMMMPSLVKTKEARRRDGRMQYICRSEKKKPLM